MNIINRKVVIFLMLGVLLIVLISPFASSSPDGLEWVAAQFNFVHKAEDFTVWKHPLLNDYSVLTGLVGMFATFIIMFLVSNVLKQRGNRKL